MKCKDCGRLITKLHCDERICDRCSIGFDMVNENNMLGLSLGLKGRLFDRNYCFNCKYNEICSLIRDDGYTTSDIEAKTIKCPNYEREIKNE